MSILDMDVTTRRNPELIRKRVFARVRKGYDPDQVREYLGQVADWVIELQEEARDARSGAPTHHEIAFTGPDPFASLGSHVAEILRTADQHAEQLRREAQEAAEQVLADARRESTSTMQRAKAESEQMRKAATEEADRAREEAAAAEEQARVEAERTLARMSERKSAVVAELRGVKERLSGVVAQLDDPTLALDDPNGDPKDRVEPPSADGRALDSSDPSTSGPREERSTVMYPAFTPPPDPPGRPDPPAEGEASGADDAAWNELFEGETEIELVLPDLPTFDDIDLGEDDDPSEGEDGKSNPKP